MKSNDNKEKLIQILQGNVMDQLNRQLKESEQDQEKQLKEKMDSLKEPEEANYVRNAIKKWVSEAQFKKLSGLVQANGHLTVELKATYGQAFDTLHKTLTSMDQDKSRIKIKLNAHWQKLAKETDVVYQGLTNALNRLAQAGCCGVGTEQRNFANEFRKFEFISLQWNSLPNYENNAVDFQLIRAKMDVEHYRKFLIDQLRSNFPEGNGETKIVEKIVEKRVEVPVDRIVTKEVFVDKIVEKIVEKRVEVKVPVEVIKEMYRDAPEKNDRLQEAHEMMYGIGRPQILTEALNIYYEEAEVNQNVTAYNALAKIFWEGKFFPQDLNKAYCYWEKSAAVGHPEGLYRLGRLLLDGNINGIQLSGQRIQTRDKELEEAVVYIQQAVESGHLDGLVDLGEIFEKGLYSEDGQTLIQDIQLEQAEYYYLQGKKVRYPRALNAAGLFYLNHPDYQEKIHGNNARKAIKYFEMARELGYIKSWYYLGMCHEQGLGVPVNQEKAKSYYKEGALRNDADCKSHYMFYIMQDAGNSGKHEDYLYCHNYLLEIIANNPELTEAYYYLGHLYECGFGVLKDPNNSIHYFSRGAKLKNAACMTKLGDFYHSGFGVPQNSREALKYYSAAAALKDSAALVNMGAIYEQGYDGIAIDHAKAFNCYEEASKMNNANAFFHIGLMYEAGRYVKKDTASAIEQYRKAALMGCQPARDLLEKKQVPMIYSEGVNQNQIDLDVYDTQEDMRKVPIPMISNPLVVNTVKKTNQSILASKNSQLQHGEGKMISILTQQAGTQSNQMYPGNQDTRNFVQSHVQR